MIASGTWKVVGTATHDAPFLLWFRVSGDASVPSPVKLRPSEVVRSAGGPLDLLVILEGDKCPEAAGMKVPAGS